MTDAAGAPARPPLGLALGSLLEADALVLLQSRISLGLGALLPIALLVVTNLGRAPGRLGGAKLVIGLALTVGLLTSSLFGYTQTLARDREAGVLQRLRVAPVPSWTIMTSRLGVQLVTALVTSAVVVVAGVRLHGLALSAGQYALMIAVAGLGAAMFLAIGQALVGLVQSSTAINALSRLLMIVLLLLGLLGGTGILGDTTKTVADWSPVGALMNLFTGVLNQSASDGQATRSLLACVGYMVVFGFIGVRWFRWGSR